MKWIIALLIMTLIFLSIIVIKQHQVNNEFNENINTIQNAYYEVVNAGFKNWLLTIDSLKNVALTNVESKKEHLFGILNGDKIIFYFDNKMCDMCVDKELDDLIELGKIIGYENIIVIGKAVNPRVFMKEEFILFSNNLWVCDENIYTYRDREEVPSVIFTRGVDILVGYHGLKITNDMNKMFMKFIREEFLFVNK